MSTNMFRKILAKKRRTGGTPGRIWTDHIVQIHGGEPPRAHRRDGSRGTGPRRQRGESCSRRPADMAARQEEYDKIAPVIACTLPALTDSIPERKRGELAGEVTRELQVVGKAASIAI